MTKYETHDNGGRPFFVEIDGGNVSVSKNMDTYEKVDGKYIDIELPPKHLFNVKPEEIFIGKKSRKGGYDGLDAKKAVGNSILLNVGSTTTPKYMFIGHEIYEFVPVKGDSIVKYYSDIGNSDVPYPYAVGKTHIYFMLDKEAVDISYFDMKKDIYEQYYFEHRATMCLKGNPKSDLCKDKQAVKERIREFNDKRSKLKTKQIEKRVW